MGEHIFSMRKPRLVYFLSTKFEKVKYFKFLLFVYLICQNLLAFSQDSITDYNAKLKKINTLLSTLTDNKKVFGTSFVIQYKGQTWQESTGNLTNNRPYFIASTTKLFVTAIILQLESQHRIHLDSSIKNYLPASLLAKIHYFNGVDYSNSITVKHLLSHTSGLPDYLEDKDKNGNSLEDTLLRGIDMHWSLQDIIHRSNQLKPHFPPGTKGKAHYSDTNFQLLAEIIKQITGKDIDENIKQFITVPLQMNSTYMFRDINDTLPQHLYYKNKPLLIPKAMTSFAADGGLVSTTPDMIIFIRAFFQGALFPKEKLKELYQWNPIFFPLEAGVGLHRFKLPKFMDPFGVVPVLYGHSGLSGALAYYSPELDLFIAGTVNQIDNRSTSFQTMIKLIQIVK